MHARIWPLGCFIIIISAAFATGQKAKDTLTRAEAGMRLRHAQNLARDSNDPSLAAQVERAAQDTVDAFTRNDLPAAELLVRGAEKAVGLDPGGKTMNGLPVAQLPKEKLREVEKLIPRLEAAMRGNDSAAVRDVVAEMSKALGDQAGLPDARNRGEKPEVRPVRPVDVADLFVRVLNADEPTYTAMANGRVFATALPRLYGEVAKGCCLARPIVEKHLRRRLADVDKLVKGCCTIMLELQTAEGFFRFPDLRGRHLRFGETIDKLVQDNPDAVKDGWVVVPLPDGGSQYDARECGVALLHAGELYQNDAWKRAGLKAADWAMKQPCVASFHDNAMSVSLLAQAYLTTKDSKYLDAAVGKFRIGLAPGQVENGRWVDPLNARTAYHFIILRSLNDLADTLPADKKDVRDEIAAVSRKAVKSILDEFDAVGVTNTSDSVAELTRYQRMHPDADMRLRKHIERSAAAVLERCFRDGEVRAGVPLPALASVAGVWKERGP